MHKHILVALILLFGVLPAMAQTPTPDPLLTCSKSDQVGDVIINFVRGLVPGITAVDVACKSNEINPAQLEAIYKQLREAADQINALPDEIKKAGPSGQTITDVTAGVGQIAGYVKWLFSYNSAQELLGSDFAPIGTNILVVFTMTVAMIAIYIAINLVVFTIKMVVWIVNQVLKLIPFW